MSRWLLYGANGYTGRLIAREAIARGMRPTLGGRSRAAIEGLGAELDCETLVASLEGDDLASLLKGFDVVLNSAGPFSRTCRPMLDACLAARCHYLDVSGELDVMAATYERHRDATEARIAIVPAVGFNVVPMDCLAAKLAGQCDRAIRLELGFEGYELSGGTAKTYLEGIASGTARRVGGTLVRSPLAWELYTIPFKLGLRLALPVPYGELVSSYRATGIPDIAIYMVPPPSLVTLLKYGPRFAPLFRFGWVQRVADRFAERRFKGPDEATMRTGRTQIWGRVTDANGVQHEGYLETPEPYRLSAMAAVAAVARLLKDKVPAGAWTPAQAFGVGFLDEIGGCTFERAPERPAPASGALSAPGAPRSKDGPQV
ncbi:MAG: saccharopine dehydrogenase NADP-binding domain-containing protein [Polyangiaceae bacterium]